MAHTSTEQADPWVIIEKLRKQHRAEIHETWMPLVAELRIQLEAYQTQRVPLSEAQIEQAMGLCDVCEGDHVLGAFSAGARHIEKLYGIAQEKQG